MEILIFFVRFRVFSRLHHHRSICVSSKVFTKPALTIALAIGSVVNEFKMALSKYAQILYTIAKFTVRPFKFYRYTLSCLLCLPNAL